LQFAQANTQTKNCKRACFANAEKIVFKKFPNTSKKIKTYRHTARQTKQTMTQKLNIDKTYGNTVDRRPAGNSTYKKLAVQWLNEALCFLSSSVLADSFRLRNRQLLLAAKRCGQRQDKTITEWVTRNLKCKTIGTINSSL
jgi:hypothetical protein